MDVTERQGLYLGGVGLFTLILNQDYRLREVNDEEAFRIAVPLEEFDLLHALPKPSLHPKALEFAIVEHTVIPPP